MIISPTSPVIISYATLTDVPPLACVYRDAHNMRIANGKMGRSHFVKHERLPGIQNSLLHRMEEGNFNVLIARHPAAVAYLSFEQWGSEAKIHDFYAVPSPHHYGDILMNSFFDQARDLGIQKVGLRSSQYARNKYLTSWKFRTETSNPDSALLVKDLSL